MKIYCYKEINMTIRECYELMGSDFDGVLRRLGSEAIIARVAVKFLNDPSFGDLRSALDEGRTEDAFRAAHTLKGVCVNLGFDKLYESSSVLTELLRAGRTDGADELFAQIEASYGKTVEALTAFKDSQ